MTINEKQDEIIEELSVFDDWMDKYQYIIDLGNEVPGIAAEFQTDDYLIKGCQSKVWFNAELNNGIIDYNADSDAIIVKGIVSLLTKVLSGHSPKEIMDADLYFIDQIGLKEHLSPTRSNGLVAMVKQMKLYAVAFNHKLNG